MTLGVTAVFFAGVFAADGFTATLAELVLAGFLGAVATVRAEAGLTAVVFLIVGAVGALLDAVVPLAGALLTTLLAVALADVLSVFAAAVLVALALTLVLALAVVWLLLT